MEDYRVRTGWRNHPKRKKIMRRLGPEGVVALYDLWEFCAESRPDGNLSGLSDEDVAIGAGWDGDPNKLIDALREARLIDGVSGSYTIHDWEQHNPWVAGSDRRSEVGRLNSLKRWHNKGLHVGAPVDGCRQCAAQRQTMPEALPTHATRNAGATNRQCSDSDSDSDSDSSMNISPSAEAIEPAPSAPDTQSGKSPSPAVLTEAVRDVVRYYRQKHPGKGRQLKPGHADWRRIEARLREGFSADELKLAIDGNAMDDWHRSNPAGHTVEYVFRNATKVEGFIATARGGTGPPRGRSVFRDVTEDLLRDWVQGDDRQGEISSAHDQTPVLLPEPGGRS